MDDDDMPFAGETSKPAPTEVPNLLAASSSTKRSYWLLGIALFVLALAYSYPIWFASTSNPLETVDTEDDDRLFISEHDTQSKELSMTEDEDTWWTSALRELLGSRHACLCAHHLHKPPNWTHSHYPRLCVMNLESTVHIMYNMSMVGALGGDVKTKEQSVSCEDGTIREHWRCTAIKVRWKNALYQTYHGHLFEDQAFCFQLALDEFRGNRHC